MARPSRHHPWSFVRTRRWPVKLKSSHSGRIRLRVRGSNTRTPTEVKPLADRDRVTRKPKKKEK